LSCKAASARAARSFVKTVLRSEEVEDEIKDVVRLAVSELVTNSVVHGGTEVALRVVVGVEKLYGEVTDYDTALPTLVEATDGAAGDGDSALWPPSPRPVASEPVATARPSGSRSPDPSSRPPSGPWPSTLSQRSCGPG
jgi:hypothetical protein